MRKFVVLLGLLLLVSVAANAQDNSKVEIFGGYSHMWFGPNAGGAPDEVGLNGGIGSFAFNASSSFSIVGEVGGYHASTIKFGSNTASGLTANIVTYMGGPKVSMHRGKISPFVQILAGGAHGTLNQAAEAAIVGPPAVAAIAAGSVSQNAFALSIGGGVDVNLTPHIGVRLGQLDYVYSHFKNGPNSIDGNGTSGQNNIRYSGGVIIHF